MPYTVPVVADFKSRFDRDFLYSVDQTDIEGVRDTDISRALFNAGINFNSSLWESQAIYSEAYLLAAAHFLCQNILAGSEGLGGTGSWLTNSKAVGNVSETFAIPERISRSPTLSIYSRTLYGQTYLSLLMLRLVGNVVGVRGDTTP